MPVTSSLKFTGICFVAFLFSAARVGLAIEPPTGLVSRAGDRSIVLHWDRNTETNFSLYRVYRALDTNGPFLPVSFRVPNAPSFCDLNVTNSTTYYYQVTTLDTVRLESQPTPPIPVTPHAFSSEDEFLDYVQQTGFDYFWYEANPTNGLVRDRSTPTSPCSIAAVGFG